MRIFAAAKASLVTFKSGFIFVIFIAQIYKFLSKIIYNERTLIKSQIKEGIPEKWEPRP